MRVGVGMSVEVGADDSINGGGDNIHGDGGGAGRMTILLIVEWW